MLTHAVLIYPSGTGSLIRSLSKCADPRTGGTHGALLDEAGGAFQPQRIERMMWEQSKYNYISAYLHKFTVYMFFGLEKRNRNLRSEFLLRSRPAKELPQGSSPTDLAS
jgi:hypothetical protein